MEEDMKVPTKVIAEATNFDIKYLLPSRMELQNRKKISWFTRKRGNRFIESKIEIVKILDNPSTENTIRDLLSYLKEDPDSPDFLKNARTEFQRLIKFYKNWEKTKEKIKQLQDELLKIEKEIEKEKARIEKKIDKIKKRENLLKTKKEKLNNLQAQEQKARLIETALQLTKNINHWIKYCDHRKKKLNIEDVIKMFFDWKKESRIIKAQEEATEMIQQLEETIKKMDKQLEELKEVKICM